MKDMQQIQRIADSLQHKKDQLSYELTKLNSTIANKKLVIDRMIAYQKDYFNGENLLLSKSIPGLNKNIHLFTQRIDNVINQAQREIDHLNGLKKEVLISIAEIDKKMDVLQIFHEKCRVAKILADDKQEQRLLDDLSATLKERMEHD